MLIFFKEIVNNNHLPCCCITGTKLGSVKSYTDFINCFENFGDFVEDEKYRDDKQSIGLLLTVDDELSDGNEIFKLEYWKLFPNSKEHFLHA